MGTACFPVLDQNTGVPEALSATRPNIPAGRPSEANKHINNITEHREDARRDRDGQAPHR